MIRYEKGSLLAAKSDALRQEPHSTSAWERGRPAREITAQPSATSPEGSSAPHRYWHSRGYLPHFDGPDVIQTITMNLFDAVPTKVIAAWKADLAITDATRADDPRHAELRERIAKYEDEGHGSCFMRDPRVARIVEDAILHFDGERYRLVAWCVMPNHVHAMAVILEGHPLDHILFSWKSFTSKAANRILGRTGRFWMPEYFDRYVRDERHYNNAVAYIEQNPVKAGLCLTAEQWPWSSARRRLA
jgi:REP element-mobilizing transposase RayT